jgi:hypothetical protein
MILVRNSIKGNLQLCLSLSREMVLPGERKSRGTTHKLGFSGMSMDGCERNMHHVVASNCVYAR